MKSFGACYINILIFQRELKSWKTMRSSRRVWLDWNLGVVSLITGSLKKERTMKLLGRGHISHKKTNNKKKELVPRALPAVQRILPHVFPSRRPWRAVVMRTACSGRMQNRNVRVRVKGIHADLLDCKQNGHFWDHVDTIQNGEAVYTRTKKPCCGRTALKGASDNLSIPWNRGHECLKETIPNKKHLIKHQNQSFSLAKSFCISSWAL